MVLVVAFIVYVERSERRIPVQYAKRVVGRKIMGGQSTHLPLRVNSGGVMPVIFASSILTLPQTLPAAIAGQPLLWPACSSISGWGEPLYTLLYAVGIIFFAYFYVSIVFNPSEVADNMRKYGGFIPGIRPGQAHGGLHQRSAHPHHPGRRAISDPDLADSGVDDRGHSS